MRALAVTFGLAVLAGGCGRLPVFHVDMSIDFAVVRPPSFSSLYGEYLSACASCHSPTAMNPPAGIEQTLDFSTRAAAYDTLTNGMASGLTGASQSCNGVPFIDSGDPGGSLVFATLDAPVRDCAAGSSCFKAGPCTDKPTDMTPGAAVTDEASKVMMAMPASFLSDFGLWIALSSPNN